MTPTRQGSVRLARIAGIDLYLHWSWFVVAAFEIGARKRSYSSLQWNAFEYLALFAIVALHEFGHALACRQVGGEANQIVLWPFGGVAYVNPPPRPGAVLWSIAAGPLVNVVLVPVLMMLGAENLPAGWPEAAPNLPALLHTIWIINLMLLAFNLLPVYPLDGGQILRALLWFFLGRARSLMVASIIGVFGVAGLIAVAVWLQSIWIGLISLFILSNCWRGFQQARMMIRVAAMPHRDGFACPSCRTAPIEGAFWVCGQCRQAFDTFATGAVCPQCGAQFDTTRCLECGRSHPWATWVVPPAAPPVA